MRVKKKTMYEIRCWKEGVIYSVLLSNKLRDSKRSIKLVKRLKGSGIDAFRSKVEIKVPA